ncbi:MAG: ribbon-helix-helix domain-containing protein [Hyphomicrobiaceae bacterium]
MTEMTAGKQSGRSSAAADRKAAISARSGVKRRLAKPQMPAERYPIGKDRKQRKGIAIYMHPLAKDVLDTIARENGKTVQDLGIEALNLLFVRYGEKPIA